MQDFTPGETLASLQAMIIYTIMRLMDFGIGYLAVNRDMLKTNRVGSKSREKIPKFKIDSVPEALAFRFLQLHPGSFSPPHARLYRPTWEEWIFEETRRRYYYLSSPSPSPLAHR